MLINNSDQISLANIPGLTFAIKDRKSRLLSLTSSTAKMLGFTHSEAGLGISDYDLPCPVSEHADYYVNQDQDIINNKKTLDLLALHRYAHNEMKCLITKKGPVYDNQANVLGVYVQAQEIPIQLCQALAIALYKNQGDSPVVNRTPDFSYTLQDSIPDAGVTPRELECLFLFLRGNTPKQISMFLQLSIRTVEFYLANLRLKFACHNKEQLIEYAYQKGYDKILPKRFFNENLPLILQAS